MLRSVCARIVLLVLLALTFLHACARSKLIEPGRAGDPAAVASGPSLHRAPDATQLSVFVSGCMLRNLSPVPGATFLHMTTADRVHVPAFAVRVRADGRLDDASRGRGDIVYGSFPKDAWLSEGTTLHAWTSTGWANSTRATRSLSEQWFPYRGDYLMVAFNDNQDPVLRTTHQPPADLRLPLEASQRKFEQASVIDDRFFASGSIGNRGGLVFVAGHTQPIETGVLHYAFPTHEPGAKHVLVATEGADLEPRALELSREQLRDAGPLPTVPLTVHTSASNEDWLLGKGGAVYRRSPGKSWQRQAELRPAGDWPATASIATQGANVWIIYDGRVFSGGKERTITAVPPIDGVGSELLAVKVLPDLEGRVWIPFAALNDTRREAVLVTSGPVPRRVSCSDLVR